MFQETVRVSSVDRVKSLQTTARRLVSTANASTARVSQVFHLA